MKYETYRHPDAIDDSRWVAIAIDHESEGEVYTACFGGYFAKERAEEYAAWKNAGGGAIHGRPTVNDHAPAKDGARE